METNVYMKGIRFRGPSMPEYHKVLPVAKPGGEALPEDHFWLLLTRKVPTKEQVVALSKELRNCATTLEYVYKAIDSLHVTAHPMTQFTTDVMVLQESVNEDDLQTPVSSGAKSSNLSTADTIPFLLNVTPPNAKANQDDGAETGVEKTSATSKTNEDDVSDAGSSGSLKRNIIDLDASPHPVEDQKRGKTKV
ncbi:citrate synthase, mitochondrial [Artemisia annua]|uniref:Citrate synthase, mitochondrial n=1 Tax=Artemisia annua TaxID=35608 RepID=A0A2U1P7J2_ARTAN|nr:citrate synthase, mitochondrial [Artemisia annua]